MTDGTSCGLGVFVGFVVFLFALIGGAGFGIGLLLWIMAIPITFVLLGMVS